MSGVTPRRAQLVIGPAGSGKTTYCSALSEPLALSHRRRCAVVNLDPAADRSESDGKAGGKGTVGSGDTEGYVAVVDVRELICLEDVMEEMGLGMAMWNIVVAM